jgi:TetR/AcrR family transcriptional regulator, transcriptional repressor of aconitase
MRGAGRLPADADPAALGATLSCLLPGFVLQRLLVGDVDGRTLRAGFHALAGAT